MGKLCGIVIHYVQDTRFGDYKITDFRGEGFGGNMRMECIKKMKKMIKEIILANFMILTTISF